MDPNSVLFVVAMGAMLGVVLGFLVSGEGYGWLLNAIAGAVGAVLGGQLLANSGVDLGPLVNSGIAAGVTSGLTALVLRS